MGAAEHPSEEKEMATHSSVLAWRIPGTGSVVGCHLWGRTESDTTEATYPNLGVLGSASTILLQSLKIYFPPCELFSLF